MAWSSCKTIGLPPVMDTKECVLLLNSCMRYAWMASETREHP